MHASCDAQPVLDFFAQAADPVLNPDLQLHSIRPRRFPGALPALVRMALKIARHVAQQVTLSSQG